MFKNTLIRRALNGRTVVASKSARAGGLNAARHRRVADGRLEFESLEDRLAPAAGLFGGSEQLLSSYGELPLSFEANQGQTAAQVQYLSHGNGYSLFLTPEGAVLNLVKPVAAAASQDPAASSNTSGVALAINLVGANPHAAVAGLDPLPGTSNYFLGNDPSQWRTGIANVSQVEYKDVYPGINLVYYGNQRQLEYDYRLAPGADPANIRFSVEGADSLSLDQKGNLVMHTASGDVLENAPTLYQEIAGKRESIAGQFVLFGSDEVGFQVGKYDVRQPLVIDPVLSYSTYLGGNGSDNAYSIAVDNTGSAYMAGSAGSTNFPTSTGAFQSTHGGGLVDGFVAKLNPGGTALVYSTYLGGVGSYDSANSIAVDSSGNAYVTGATNSVNFPTTAGAALTTFSGGADGFVTKLNPSGSGLAYSTFLGVNGSSSYIAAYGIALDSSGNVYVAGATNSVAFATSPGAFQSTFGGGASDAFAAELNSSGAAFVNSTYLGGSGDDTGYAVTLDGEGNAYVAGSTNSANFPTSAGAFQTTRSFSASDAFVTKFGAAGTALSYSTYLGGESSDSAFGIAVDSSGSAYVAGATYSYYFPTTAGALQTAYGGADDAFVTKLNASGTGLDYSTYLGGSNADTGYGIAVDSSGNAYVTGATRSANFPATTGAFQSTYRGGANDAYVTKLNATGTALIYSTYLGGTGDDSGNGIALDSSGNAYVGGGTTSANFPTSTSAFQTTSGGGGDVFVAKLALINPAATSTTLTATPNATTGGQLVTFTATIAPSPGDQGTVAFRDSGQAIAGGSNVPVTGGVATFQIATLRPGSHLITAAYSGAVGFESSSSSALSFSVTGIETTTTIVAAAPNPALVDQAISLTVTVAGGESTSDGESITVIDASNNNTPLPTNGGVLSGGSASFFISPGALSVGTHNLVAFYAGNVFNNASQSAAIPVVIITKPQVVSVAVNGNIPSLVGVQRSRVVSLVVTFDRPVQLDTGAVTIALHSNRVFSNGVDGPFGDLPTNLVLSTSDNISWVVTFDGNTDSGADGLNSIRDGVYDLTVDAAKFHPIGLDGINGAGSSTTAFYRLFGDVTGEYPIVDATHYTTINTTDNLDFRTAFNSASGTPGTQYKAYFDFDGDGFVNTADSLQFRDRFNRPLGWSV